MKPTPDSPRTSCRFGSPLEGATPAAWQSQFRAVSRMGGAGFMRCVPIDSVVKH